MVVLDKDYMAVSDEEIGQITGVMTIVGGKVIYDNLNNHARPANQTRRLASRASSISVTCGCRLGNLWLAALRADGGARGPRR
jgi:hypothetical protein